MPTISVIVPVYKVENYIHRCIDSILNQTYRDFELILVDDGSPDKCGAICDEYAAKDGRIVVIHQKNGGLSAARNAGIDWAFANSDSGWLTFIDSDDLVHKNYLQSLLHACTHCSTYISSCLMASDSLEDIPDTYVPESYPTEDLYSSKSIPFNKISSCGKLYAKQLWDGVRFPVGKLHEDRFTTHKLLFQIPEISSIPYALYLYTINPEGITHSQWTPRRMDDLEAIEAQFRYFEEHNYRNAWNRTAESAFYAISGMIREITQNKNTLNRYSHYLRTLKKKLRFYLRRHKRSLGITLDKYCFVYEAAYPNLMRIYWYWIALLRKLGFRK